MKIIKNARGLALATAVVALAGLNVSPAGAAQFVGLGDSSASGPLIPNQTTAHPGCTQSDHNYAHLAAAQLGKSLTDVSCGGATTENMTTAQSVVPGPANPPQFDALDNDTEIVTLQIGGNDIGVEQFLVSCVAVLPIGHPCTDRYTSGGTDQMAAKIAAVAPKVGAVLDGIHQHAPNAEVYVISYPTLVPPSGSCWPLLPIAPDDIPYIRTVGDGVSAMFAQQAAAHGATFVDAHTAGVPFNACTSPTTRWTEPLVPLNIAAPLHPNANGEAGMAALLVAAAS